MSSSAIAVEGESPDLCAHHGDAGADMTPMRHVRLSGGAPWAKHTIDRKTWPFVAAAAAGPALVPNPLKTPWGKLGAVIALAC